MMNRDRHCRRGARRRSRRRPGRAGAAWGVSMALAFAGCAPVPSPPEPSPAVPDHQATERKPVEPPPPAATDEDSAAAAEREARARAELARWAAERRAEVDQRLREERAADERAAEVRAVAGDEAGRDKVPPPAHAPRPPAPGTRADAPEAGAPADGVTAAIDRAIGRLSWGKIGFEPPTHIRLGDIQELHLVLSPSADDAELAELVPVGPDGGGMEVHRVRFSDRMIARLESAGGGLRVSAITPEEQGVSGLEPTTWIWSIEAVDGGTHRLRLTLDALLEVNGERVPRSIRSFAQDIEVTVSPWQRVAGNGLLAAVGLLLALGGLTAWLARSRVRRTTPARSTAAGAAGAAGAAAAEGESHEIFISHSSKDRVIADSVCDALETAGVRCWVAPRDIVPGKAWDEAIMDAIYGCRIMVLVLSERSNSSAQVTKEVRNAVEGGVTVIPFRTEDVALSKALRYHISAAHWLDAVEPPLQRHLDDLVRTVRHLLDIPAAVPAGAQRSGE